MVSESYTNFLPCIHIYWLGYKQLHSTGNELDNRKSQLAPLFMYSCVCELKSIPVRRASAYNYACVYVNEVIIFYDINLHFLYPIW